MNCRTMRPEDLPAVERIWNACAEAGEVLYSPLDREYFRRKFVEGPGCEPDLLLVAECGDQAAGFLHGAAPGSFPGSKPGCAYLTMLLVDAPYRGRGIGRALLNTFRERLACRKAETLYISGLNPVQLDWRIPGTPGHDHNNMPGADTECAGYSFLKRYGFSDRYQQAAMYMDLSGWTMPAYAAEKRERLREEGIETGPYDAARDCGYDRMCDSVGSDYWRDVLRTETAAWKAGKPNADPRMWADGIPPRGPRTLLTAVHGGEIVGFTGPVDLQKSGRGWFTGICTDPAYEGRGIGTVLFSLLLEAFVREGASFTSLFTGFDNPARKIYEKAGLRTVRQFSLMSMAL